MDNRTTCVFAAWETLCLDYANTRSWRGSETPTERLLDVSDVVRWSEASTLKGHGGTRGFLELLKDEPSKAATFYSEAIAIREVVYRVFSAVAQGLAILEQDYVDLARKIASSPGRNDIALVNGRYGWRIRRLKPTAIHLLAPVLWSAGDLLIAAPNRRIRRCTNDECLWLFLDESKNGTRRWCDMSTCGNRAKARHHYSKIKRGAAE